MPDITLAKFISDKLTEAEWPKVELQEDIQVVKSKDQKILEIKRQEYHLKFYFYIPESKEFGLRDRLAEIVFPINFNIRHLLYFNRRGKYQLSFERQFKNIINPLGRNISVIKIKDSYSKLKFYKNILMLPTSVFESAMRDAQFIYRKSKSYKTSTENYLSNIKSQDYSNNVRKRRTYIEKGEFNFLVDRLYLKSKRNKKDFLKYLNEGDISSAEELITELLKHDVLSEDFLRRLNDYFIRERLKDIISLGKEILSLGVSNLSTVSAQKVINKLGSGSITQLETLWQKYFEKNLLYLIFTYKKIFPKVKLTNIDGDKKYPDFVGINHYNGLDIIEIKTHLKNVLMWDSSHHNFYFSSEMSKAIVQTTNYMDAIIQRRFQDQEDHTKITNFTDEENLYHPRGIIIISSKEKLSTKRGEDEKLRRDFTKLRNSLHNIEILTFDEIINIADEYLKNIVIEE